MLCEANGPPLRFRLSGGQASNISYAQPLRDEVSIPSSQRGRPHKRCKWLLANNGYDAATYIECNRSSRCAQRMFGWLNENRRIVTRFDKLTKSYASVSHWLVLYGVFDISFRTEPRRSLLASLPRECTWASRGIDGRRADLQYRADGRRSATDLV